MLLFRIIAFRSFMKTDALVDALSKINPKFGRSRNWKSSPACRKNRLGY